MTQMFDNFENQPQGYVPNNMFVKPLEKWVEIDNDNVHRLFKGC